MELNENSIVFSSDDSPKTKENSKTKENKDAKAKAAGAEGAAEEGPGVGGDDDEDDDVGIQLVTPGGTLIAAALDHADQQAWVEALQVPMYIAVSFYMYKIAARHVTCACLYCMDATQQQQQHQQQQHNQA